MFRRSLFFVQDIKKGQIISAEQVKSIRPGYGVAPKFLHKIVGTTATEDFSRGTPVGIEMLEGKNE